MTTLEMIKKFTDKVNKEGNATIKVYDDNKRLDVLARAIVVTDLLVVWQYVLFNDGTYTFYLLEKTSNENEYFRL